MLGNPSVPLLKGETDSPQVRSMKKIRDYEDSHSPRRPNHMKPTHMLGKPSSKKRISSHQNIGIILEQVLNHTTKNSSKALLNHE